MTADASAAGHTRLRRGLCLGVLSCGLAATAHAEPAPQPTAVREEPAPYSAEARPRSRPVSFEQITITARKREERLQDVSAAVTAFTRDEMRDLDIRGIQDITNYVPNLAFDSAAETTHAARINLRAVGNGDPIASDDPGVGIYLDGVYLSRAQASLFTVSDVERVEVLRGPQGTLFGKNTIGGAVNVISRKPTLDAYGGGAEVRIGNYDRFDSRIWVNLPLVPERAAARLSFASATRDGFVKNKSTGSDLDDDKVLAFRGQLLLLPTEDLEIQLAMDHSLEDRKPQGYKCKVTNPFALGQNAQSRPDVAAGSEFEGPGTAAIFAQQIGATPAQQLANLAGQTNPFLAQCAEDELRDDRSVASELSHQEEDVMTLGTQMTVTWDFTENVTLRSISSWRRLQMELSRDFDATAESLLARSVIDAGGQQQDQLSQEFQLTGSALRGRLTYVGGLFWFNEKNGGLSYGGVGSGQTFAFPSVPGDPASPLAFQHATFQADRLAVDNLSYAAYGQATYGITPKLSTTLGLRVTSERKRIRRDSVCHASGLSAGQLCAFGGELLFAFEASTRSKDVSPVATLKYELSDQAQVYATWSRGFKSGGFNGRADQTSLTNRVSDEMLTSYELGFKSMLFDNRVRLNGAVFHNVYEDIQLTIVRGNPDSNRLEVALENAGQAEIRGAELELRAFPIPALEVSSAIGITHARYTEFDGVRDTRDPRIPDDPKDRHLPNTPTYTFNVGASYQLPVGALGDVRVRADWTHIGRSGTDLLDSRELRKGKHGELDAQLLWMLPDGKTELAFFASNLLNRSYVTNGINFGASFGHSVLTYNAPRTYGLEVRRSF